MSPGTDSNMEHGTAGSMEHGTPGRMEPGPAPDRMLGPSSQHGTPLPCATRDKYPRDSRTRHPKDPHEHLPGISQTNPKDGITLGDLLGMSPPKETKSHLP